MLFTLLNDQRPLISDIRMEPIPSPSGMYLLPIPLQLLSVQEYWGEVYMGSSVNMCWVLHPQCSRPNLLLTTPRISSGESPCAFGDTDSSVLIPAWWVAQCQPGTVVSPFTQDWSKHHIGLGLGQPEAS